MKPIFWIPALVAFFTIHPPAQADVNLKLIRAIEHLDRANARLELETDLALIQETNNEDAATDISSALIGGASNITIGVVAAKQYPMSWPKLEPVLANTSFILGIAFTALYFGSVAGNGFGWTDVDLPNGSSGGTLMLTVAGLNFLTFSIGRPMVDLEGAGISPTLALWGTLLAGASMVFKGSAALSENPEEDEKSVHLDPNIFIQNPQKTMANLTAERSAHLLGLDKKPFAVARIKEYLADSLERESETDLLLDLAELEDETGEKLVTESVAFRASQLAEAYAAQAPALLQELPKEISLSDRAESSLKLLQTRIGALERYAEENPSALLSKTIEDAKKRARIAQIFLGFI